MKIAGISHHVLCNTLFSFTDIVFHQLAQFFKNVAFGSLIRFLPNTQM